MVELTRLPTLYLSDSWYARVAAAQLPPETDIVKLKTRLYDQYSLEDPLVNWNGMKFVRISVQAYNTQRDADQFLEAMSNLL